MIHVATQEDVLSHLVRGWQLRGLTTPGKRGLTYWLLPADTSPYAAKRVSAKIVTRLEVDGEIVGFRDQHGELRFILAAEVAAPAQPALLSVGA